jgi:hypothetical protein
VLVPHLIAAAPVPLPPARHPNPPSTPVIRYDLEYLGLCPCMVDVEIIDAKNDNQVRPRSSPGRGGRFLGASHGYCEVRLPLHPSLQPHPPSTAPHTPIPSHTHPTPPHPQSIFVSAGPEACSCHKVWGPGMGGPMRGMPQVQQVRGLAAGAGRAPGRA